MNRSTAELWRREAQLLLDACTAERRQALRTDPLEAVDGWGGVRLEFRSEVRNPGLCNTDGFYDADADPPRILVATSASRRRQAFTALHELGHHLSLRHAEVADLLWKPDGDRIGEEICDAFAATVLFPDEVIDAVFDGPAPTARQVATLFHTVEHASRAACCVAAARLLQVEGYVLVANLDGVVQYAASAHTPYRLARGVRQPERGLFADAAARGRARGPCHITYRSGTVSPQMAGDAVRDDQYVFAVMIAGIPPWGGAWDAPGDQRATPAERDCGHCGETWQGWVEERCGRCSEPHCPACGRCACLPATTERVCPDCGLFTAAYTPGATVCNDCTW